ncbi:AzlC family ABC transporter permease [Archaeoglobus neptunius]|uniref:AzlC family ABC transporter permease n=1 Tax=Archaeoglobus neptunius TaxID=2798580 RepID=UPI0019258D42|nr:AzlC family ABC transporter permease [Archaeoglobus neptunius]
MFRRGLVASFPIVIGYLPVAMTFGVVAVSLGFGKVKAILASVLIFAGASQFALVSLFPDSLVNAVVIPVILNLRHVVYGYILSQKFEIRRPALTAFGLTDEVFAVSLDNSSDVKNERFVLGLEVGAYLSWVSGTVIGVLSGVVLLSNKILAPSLLFSLTALFFVLLISNLRNSRPLSAIIGGSIALLFHYLGSTSTGILLAAILTPLMLKMRR